MNLFKHVFANTEKRQEKFNEDRKDLFKDVVEIAKLSKEDALLKMGSRNEGLNDNEIRKNFKKFGPNNIAEEKNTNHFLKLIEILKSPLNLLLMVLGIISFLVGDLKAGFIIILMVLLSIILNFYQETKAAIAADKLKAIIHLKTTVIRNGKKIEIPSREVVPGDIVDLFSGSVMPGDLRIISSKDLFVNEATLTGESLPVEKHSTDDNIENKNLIEINNLCFLGSTVESGSALGLVISTGKNTYLGSLADELIDSENVSDFNKELKKFVILTIKIMAIMVPIVFLLNGIFKGDWFEAFLFALAVAVGVAPEMIPTIVAVNLSKGALVLSKNKVIVKHLDSIENLGVMDILCTDKTGTLTEGKIVLEKHLDIKGNKSIPALDYAFINSYFQTGLSDIIDEAVLKHNETGENLDIKKYGKIDELPFDFSRRKMSVIVSNSEGKNFLICKGAVEEMLDSSSRVLIDGKEVSINNFSNTEKILIEKELNEEGFRVIAVGYKEVDKEKKVFNHDDEKDLVFVGFLAFFDPPKESVTETIKDLESLGVSVKILTGDNEIITKKICNDVGLEIDKILLGRDIEKIENEKELYEYIKNVVVFAKLSPYDKERIIKTLRNNNHVVGFLGDGINDALSLVAADIGISVDTAADIAKESSDLILLEKSLLVLRDGIKEGRRIFDNILKYIKMAASSNFGNMFSVVGGSMFLPFLPMLPVQILANNMLYDFSQMTIPTDNVDEDHLLKPKKWDFKNIRRFILFFGSISSLFDYATFFIMLYVFHAWGNPALFHTGWFVESLLTQTLIVHIIRTSKIPFFQSMASKPLLISTLCVMAFGIYLPFSSLADALKFVALPPLYFGLLFIGVILYFIITQSLKMWFIRKYEWI